MANYPDNWVDDGNIWCYYNVTTTESATTLGTNTNRASAMWVDGEPVTPANSYTFDTIGEHLVKFTPAQWGRYYFLNSQALVRCYLPTSITYIDDNSFGGCGNLTLLNFNSLSITRLGQQAFIGCSNLVMDNLSLPLLDTLGNGALAGCRKLTSIANLGSITSLGAYSFNGCTSLASIVLPATLTSLGNYLFPNSLKTVTSLAETPPTLGSGVFSAAPTAIYVLPSSVQAYKEAAGWSSYANKIYPLWEEAPIAINHMSLGDFRRRIMAGISNPNPIPPTGVVWYKKLVFDGTAYLNTGLNVQNKTFEWTVTWERRATSNDYGVVEKYNYNGGSNRDMQVYVRQWNTPNNSYSLYSNSSSVILPVVVPLNTKVTFTVARVAGADHYTLTAGGQTINGPTTTRDRTEPLCITKSAKAVMSSKVKIDGVIIQYLRPCTYYGEPGMWDIINNTFIGNAASSGSFSVEN